MFGKKKGYSKIKRLREIASVFIAYGFSEIITITPIMSKFKLPLKKVIPKHLGKAINEYSRPERIRFVFEELGTTFIKFGQILSSRHDILPTDITRELKKLQDHVEPFSDSKAIAIIEKDFNCFLEEVFLDFECTPKASGSIAQVYKAKLVSGEYVAIKVKRPDIEAKIRVDMEIITWLSDVLENYIKEFELLNIKKLVEAFNSQLIKELDFSFEKNNISRFYRFFENNKNIKIPRVYKEYCSSNILCIEYIDAIKVSNISEHSDTIDSKKVVATIADAMLRQVFDLGLFHADPHPGNILVYEDSRVCFIDFGMVGFITPSVKEAMSSIILSITSGNYKNMAKSILVLCDNSKIENFHEFETNVYIFISHYIDLPLSDIKIEEVFDEMISILREFNMSVSSQVMMLIKSLIVLEGIGSSLDKDFKVLDHLSIFAKKHFKNKLKPKTLYAQLKNMFIDSYSILKNVPTDIGELLSMMKKGNLSITLEHKGLNLLAHTLDKLADRLSFSIVLASLVISSALIVNAKIPPLYNGVPIIGMIGFIFSGILGFIVLIGRIVSKIKEKD